MFWYFNCYSSVVQLEFGDGETLVILLLFTIVLAVLFFFPFPYDAVLNLKAIATVPEKCVNLGVKHDQSLWHFLIYTFP